MDLPLTQVCLPPLVLISFLGSFFSCLCFSFRVPFAIADFAFGLYNTLFKLYKGRLPCEWGWIRASVYVNARQSINQSVQKSWGTAGYEAN